MAKKSVLLILILFLIPLQTACSLPEAANAIPTDDFVLSADESGADSHELFDRYASLFEKHYSSDDFGGFWSDSSGYYINIVKGNQKNDSILEFVKACNDALAAAGRKDAMITALFVDFSLKELYDTSTSLGKFHEEIGYDSSGVAVDRNRIIVTFHADELQSEYEQRLKKHNLLAQCMIRITPIKEEIVY